MVIAILIYHFEFNSFIFLWEIDETPRRGEDHSHLLKGSRRLYNIKQHLGVKQYSSGRLFLLVRQKKITQYVKL